MTEKTNKNNDLQPGGCDSTPHPPVGGALSHLTVGGVGGDLPQQIPGPPAESTQPPEKSGSPFGSYPAGPIHVIATFDTHADLLAAVRRSSGWIKIPEEAVHRALLPALTHLHLDGTLKRLDALTLPEALDVIRQMADERERLVNDIRTYVPPYRPRSKT